MPTRVLLDECVPRQLREDLAGFKVVTVQEMGWAGVKNGALIDLAAPRFDAIFTVDRDFGSGYPNPLPLAVVILEIGSTDARRLRPFIPSVIHALANVERGELRRVGA